MNPSGKSLYKFILSRLDGDKIYSQAYQEEIFDLVHKGIGGFIIFGGEKDEVKAFIEKIQSISDPPLIIASDIERGVGWQIKGYTVFPCQMAVSAAINKNIPEDIDILREAVKTVAHEAIDVGINLPLIPVLDVNQNIDNPIICMRAFSDNPEDVAWFGMEYIKIIEGSRLTSCAKHFPGHGDTSIDSHISLPIITKSYSELMNIDILPFKEAIRGGVRCVMVGHLHVSAIDSWPASLSRKAIKDLLRKELGFEGLVITDALNMSALSGIDNVSARCIDAGVDLLLHPVDVDLTVKELTSAIRSGMINERDIDTAIDRILKVKAGFQHIKRGEVDYNNHRVLSKRITDMSITLLKHRPGILPITSFSKSHIFIAGDDRFYGPSLWEGYLGNISLIKIRSNPPLIPLNPPLKKGDFHPPFTKGGLGGLKDKVAIIPLFSEVAAWRGSSGIDDEEREWVIKLIKQAKGSIVISFGSPYVLRYFREADVLIAAYEASEQAQEAVIQCLKGEKDFKGHMPVGLR